MATLRGKRSYTRQDFTQIKYESYIFYHYLINKPTADLAVGLANSLKNGGNLSLIHSLRRR